MVVGIALIVAVQNSSPQLLMQKNMSTTAIMKSERFGHTGATGKPALVFEQSHDSNKCW